MNTNGFLHHVQRKQKQKLVNEKVPSEDVLTEILIRLPAKQIARMRCVCKRWNRILIEPYFIKSHLHRNLIHNKNKDNEILLVLTSSIEDEGLMVTARPSRSPHIKLNDVIKLPANFPRTPNVVWSVIGSVNGLICFHCRDNFDIYIWNPSLSAVMRLPYLTRPSTFSYFNIYHRFTFRFGFDPKSDDYKVVKLRSNLVSDLKVEVYSMRKGTWRFISHESFPSNVYPLIFSGNTVDGHDGHVYWLCSNRSDNCKTIVAFDLDDETFFEIPLPGGGTEIKPKRYFQDLYFFNGKLCVTSYNFDDKVDEFWVMNEYGVTESWLKHHVLSQLKRDIDLVGITLNNEVYFREHYPAGRLALYDPDPTKIKYFDHCHANEETRIVQYVDSLVWITPTKKRGLLEFVVFSCW